jgi:osmotically-inducible protein OsmY
MKRIAFILCAALAAAPAVAQKTNDQATEEGRQKNTQYAKDSTLTSKVHTALANDVGLKTLRSINVDSDKGVVTLKGVVDSDEVKQRAEAVAKKVGGVTSVKNELRVKGG